MTATKAPLATGTLPGTQDFYPEEQRGRQWLYGHMHRVLQSYGYEEYNTPILEPLDLYLAKSSEEIVSQQVYSFQDRGGRKVAIRPELTPSLARLVAARQNQLPRPIRLYSIPTCMRYERPQRGRQRQFDQLNVDLLGGLPLDEDIEILSTVVSLFESLGASGDMYEIQVNHRGLVNAFLYEFLKIDRANSSALLREIDRRDKLTSEEFDKNLTEIGLTAEQRAAIEAYSQADLSGVETLMGPSEFLADLRARLSALEEIFGRKVAVFTPLLMRGFDYYTGMVFEIRDTHPDNRRALFGGGRYDNLVEAFGGEKLSGVGYGMGDITMTHFVETHGLMPVLKKPTDVVVLRFSQDDRLPALKLAQSLRAAGLRVEQPLTTQKFGKQIAAAEKIGAVAVAFQGSDEMVQNTFAVKWLKTGEQQHFPNSPEGVQGMQQALLAFKSSI